MFLFFPFSVCFSSLLLSSLVFFISLVEAELWAVVQAHVGVAEQPPGRLPQRRGVHPAQLLLRQAQVAAHLGTPPHLGDVEAVLAAWASKRTNQCEASVFDTGEVIRVALPFTFSVRHAVEEQPVGGLGSVLDEADVVAGFDARHREERHPLAGVMQRARPRPLRNGDLDRVVRRAVPVTVNLEEKMNRINTVLDFFFLSLLF